MNYIFLRMKNIYKKRLHISKDQIVEKILNSREFKVEKEYGIGGEMYVKSQVSSLFLQQIDKYSFQFAENAGLGGLIETIGRLYIEEDTSVGTIIKIKLRMGLFPHNIAQYSFFIFLLGGILALKIKPSPLWLIFFIMAFVSLVIWINKYLSARIIISKFSKTLGTDKKWID
jgi:hypothetical protein